MPISRFLTFAFAAVILLPSAAHAAPLPWLEALTALPQELSSLQGETFDSAKAATFTELNASVASSTYNFLPDTVANIGGNNVSGAGAGMTGVLGIVQNNAPGAIVQQSLNVTIGQMSIAAQTF